MAHGADARAQQCAECQALELMLVGQAVALEAFKAQALMLCSTPDCLAVALDALVALARMLSSMTGSISLALALLLEDYEASAQRLVCREAPMQRGSYRGARGSYRGSHI